jgi:hypothetical protein
MLGMISAFESVLLFIGMTCTLYMTALINLCFNLTCLCNSTSEQSPFEQLALPAPPLLNGSANPTKPDSGVDLLSWDDTPSTAENSLALVPVTDPLADSTSNQSALAIVDIFSQNNAANSNSRPLDPFGLDSSPTVPGTQPYNTQTQHPAQSQQPPQQVALYSNGNTVNPGTSYDQASQFNGTNSGWNGQVANHVAPPPQQINYGMQCHFDHYFSVSISFISFEKVNHCKLNVCIFDRLYIFACLFEGFVIVLSEFCR